MFEWDYIAPGKRMQSGFVESSMAACGKNASSGTLFTSVADARFVRTAWRHDYNNVRPHSKLGGQPPEIAGERACGHVPKHVAIPSNNRCEGGRLYL